MVDQALKYAFHEKDHLAADSQVMVLLADRKAYEGSLVKITADAEGGSCLLDTPNTHISFKKAPPLGALGPVGRCVDPVGLIRKGDMAVLQKEAGLSDQDIHLAVQYEGPPDYPLLVVLGVQSMIEELGPLKDQKLARLVLTHTNQNLEPMYLHEWIPWDAAVRAMDTARQKLRDITDPPLSSGLKKHLPAGIVATSRFTA